jgi:FAD/FMN-containing dehydrogenase
MTTRGKRSALLLLSFSAAGLLACAGPAAKPAVLNDVHSRLNATAVADYHEPATKDEIAALVKRAAREKKAVSISGGRHAMGGQQFGEGTLHINLSRYRRVLSLDEERGLVTVESGIEWPALLDWLASRQAGREPPWGIRQKQTGADKLSIGGALSCNAHGRALRLAPIVGDVESFELILADGTTRRCSRTENRELFRLAIGGYGLFGVITEVTLRLEPRSKLERSVAIVGIDEVPALVAERTERGATYGDFQFKTDERASDFLEVGVFSTYRPVPSSTPVSEGNRVLSEKDWADLYRLAHLDKARAFEVYATHYRATDGQIYWSDTDQLTPYIEGLDAEIDAATRARAPGSLMISELYVPRGELPAFLRDAREALLARKANLIYGTVRFIERDEETFLAWAKQSYACIVVNLRVTHDERGLDEAKEQFRALIDAALARGGSYYLTYHRWARKDQVLAAYPEFPDFLRLKLRYDPEERFQSQWYRHYREMFASELERP